MAVPDVMSVPELRMPPANVETVTAPLPFSEPPTTIPLLLPAETVPELAMPPEKFWTVTDAAEFGPVPALPPITMP